MHRSRSPWIAVPLTLLAIPALLGLYSWFGADPTMLARMLDPSACGALLHTPPLTGLTIPEVRALTGWTVEPAGGENCFWVVESRSGLGRGGGGSMPRFARAGPLVLTVGAAVHHWRAGEIDAVVNVGPLECMPSKVAEAQFFHVAQQEGLPALTLSLNGDPLNTEVLDNFAYEVKQRFGSGQSGVAASRQSAADHFACGRLVDVERLVQPRLKRRELLVLGGLAVHLPAGHFGIGAPVPAGADRVDGAPAGAGACGTRHAPGRPVGRSGLRHRGQQFCEQLLPEVAGQGRRVRVPVDRVGSAGLGRAHRCGDQGRAAHRVQVHRMGHRGVPFEGVTVPGPGPPGSRGLAPGPAPALR